jgi:excisionase family DNA binding protein
MQAVILQPNDFDRFISEIKQQVSQEIKAVVKTSIEEPMCVKEAAAYMNITNKTLYNRINSGEIPASVIHRNGGSVYFFKSELYQFIKNS